MNEGVQGRIKFGCGLEEAEFDDEQVLESLAANFGNKFACSLCRTTYNGIDISRRAREPNRLTSSNEIVNDYDVLTGFDSICLNLERILSETLQRPKNLHSLHTTHRAIFLLESCRDSLARELSLLTNRNESGSETHSYDRTQQESTSIQTYNNIDFLRFGSSNGT